MKHINIISLIVFSILISSCTTNNFEKESDAVFKSIRKVYTLNTDGSVNYQYQHQLKYITHYSFNRAYGESFIVYNPNQQKIKINKAETKMADGKIVPSPKNAFNEVLPRFASGAPAFNHLREMVVTHTGLEPGCIVDFDYEIISEADYFPFFNENIILQENVPVKKLEIVVNIPNNKQLNVALVHIENQPKISKKGDFTQYTWTFTNLDALEKEANQSHDQSFLPRLTFSDVSMQDALSKIHKIKDLTLSDAAKRATTKRIRDMRKGIHIINELQTIVGKEMNTYPIPLEYTAYSTRSLSEIWMSNGGTELEKIILLNELIKYAGFESKIIMVIPQEIYNDQVGNLKDFGHYYIMAHTEEEDFILTTNPGQANNVAFSIKDDIIIDINDSMVEIPDFISEVESAFSAKGDFKIDETGRLSGKIGINTDGVKNPYMHYLNNIDNAKEVVASLFSSKSILDFNIVTFNNKQSEVTATINEKEIWKNQGDYFFIEIPLSNYGIKGEHISALLGERKTPLQLSYPVNESYHFNFSVPEGFAFVAPNITKELNNEIGSVQIDIRFTKNKIQVIKHFKINKQKITSSEYSRFKNLMDLWNKDNYNKIILKKTVKE